MTSKEFQIRYQQKQKEEMERKRNEFIGSRPPVTPLDLSDNNKIQIGNGKVRQMFDERRQRVTGIDKSYPLQPISSRIVSNNSGRQTKNTTSVKRTVNPNQNGIYEHSLKLSARNGGGGGTGDMKHYPQATTITTNNRFNRNAVSSKLSDIDYIENEQTPDIFSQLDDIDSLESGRRFGGMERQMANLSVGDNNSYGNTSANIKLGPVITRKTMTHNSASSLNTNKRLPPQPAKARSIPITPQKSSVTYKNEASWPVSPTRKVTNGSITSGSNTPSSRSSASSTASASKAAVTGPPPEGMVACGICGRNFYEDRIEKHETICKKTSTKKRKVFDVTKHRVQGTEAEAYVKKAQKTKKKPEAPAKKSNWRRKHEEFIAAIRSAKQVQQHLANGGKLSDLPPPPVSENPDYVRCPTCNRSFNETAAARHIPKCASYQFNKPKTNTKTAATLGKKRF
ncbi:uncharacterized protein LOC129578157 isoform X2 [Sitodiplosis mosellana]|uniref:uncharacterized protein LOC129578157 isoform X2 n=1 Tax=Sitodiplosis mosellana TaxID=263140 RepID=UPI0024447B9E|nr:uncharacterized protein LOC129578157 isoform X2 [Sitodiplosis mosellana]